MVPSMRPPPHRNLPVQPVAVHAAQRQEARPATTSVAACGRLHRASAGTPTVHASAVPAHARQRHPVSVRRRMARPAPAVASAWCRGPGGCPRRPQAAQAAMQPRSAFRWPATTVRPGRQAGTTRWRASATAANQGGKERMRWTSESSAASGAVSWPRNQRQSLSSSQSSNRRKSPRPASEAVGHSRSSQRVSNWSSSRMPRRHRHRRRRSSAASPWSSTQQPDRQHDPQ